MRFALAVLLAANSTFAQAPAKTASVLVFVTTDCPVSNRYIPEIKRLAEKYASRGVSFSLVFPVPADTPELIDKHREKFEYKLQVIRDAKFAMMKAAGATITPQAVVYDGNKKLVYRGRIDDRYVDLGKERPAPTTHDLDDALAAIIGGWPVRETETQAVGCFLSDLIK